MGVNTEKYIRKPLYVDAVRVTAQNFDELAPWCQGEIGTEESPETGIIKKYIKVRVHQPKNLRQTKAFVGDWLLYTERGYKVYTHKAFLGSFDLVEDNGGTPESEPRDNADNPVGAEKPVGDASIDLDSPLSEEEEAKLHEEEHTTPQGEPHEYIEATPEAIADVVNEQQPPKPGDDRDEWDTPVAPAADSGIVPSVPDPVSEQPPEVAAAGKRVLSIEEQQQMGPDEVRKLVTSGDAILAQDLAETP